jgi:hypothetical protein
MSDEDDGVVKLVHTSTIPELTVVRLYEETLTKIVTGHPEFTITKATLAEATETALLNPSAYHLSSTKPEHTFVVVSDAATHLGNPIRVFVKVVGGTEGRVNSVYFAGGTYRGVRVWSAKP